MLLKSFAGLALVPNELDFEIDMTALCSEISNQSNESSYLITSIIFNLFGLQLSYEDAKELGNSLFHS